MIFRLLKNSDEISFATVDTIQEAIDLLLDAFPHIHEKLEFSKYYGIAYVNGDTWEIKADYTPPPDGVLEPAPALTEPLTLECGCLVEITGTHARIIAECKYHSPLSHR